MKTIKQKTFAFVAGVSICLLIFEISIRLIGLTYAYLAEIDTDDMAETSITILSIGDSFTFGIGATKDLSYPAQLEKMVNESTSKQKVSVINRGWPGQNSSQFLLRLPRYLEEFQPDVVTILIGGQNLVNYFGYKDYLENTGEQKRTLVMVLNDSFEQIRIYKFIRLLFRDSRSDWSTEDYPEENKPARVVALDTIDEDSVPECITGLELKEKGKYDEALQLILGIADSQDIGAECSNIVGSIYKERKQFDEAEMWFRKGIQYDLGQFRNYEDIGKSYLDRNQLKEAIFWFEKGFDNATYESLYPRCYSGIGLAFIALNNNAAALKFFEKEMGKSSERDGFLNNLAKDYLFLFQQSQTNEAIYKWLRSDVEKMIKLCKKFNATPVLQTYPFMPEINFIYKQLAKELQISIVDHQKAFEPFTLNRLLDDEYFIPDGHPNANGYNLMAKNIQVILKKDLGIGK